MRQPGVAAAQLLQRQRAVVTAGHFERRATSEQVEDRCGERVDVCAGIEVGRKAGRRRPVDDVAHRQQVPRARRIVLDISPQTDDEIVERLTSIKGVGRWTVEMLLMFTFGRMDVLPVDDMGVQEGFKRLFGLEKRPKRKEMEALAEAWRPYRSIGSWYMWRMVDDKDGLSA